MLCCLIFLLLAAQVLAFFRQARRRLRLILVDRVGVALAEWTNCVVLRKRAIAFAAVQAIGLVWVVMHWDHLKHEAASALSGRDDVVVAGPICSGDQDVGHLDLAEGVVPVL
jgi:hypothetical protein